MSFFICRLICLGFALFMVQTISSTTSTPTQHHPMSHHTATRPKPLGHQRNPLIVVVIDPGHGGKDPGATGIHQIHEKNIVLAIGLHMAALLNKTPGFKALLTRHNDTFIPLRQRLHIARADQGDMFVAIHADAFSRPSAHGASVFALSTRGATSEAARWLADQENSSELRGGTHLNLQAPDLQSMLLHLSQNATIQKSLHMGHTIISQLSTLTRLHHNHVEQAAFVVLKSPDIPSLLIETGFVSNPHDAIRLSNPNYQQQLAAAIVRGIIHYFRCQPPHGSLLFQEKSYLVPTCHSSL